MQNQLNLCFRQVSILFAGLASLVCGAGAAAHASGSSPDQLTIAVFGDSITRGVMADKTLGQMAEPEDLGILARVAANGAGAAYLPEGEWILNYGLMSANDFLVHDDLAAVQGTAPYSIASRLKQLTGRDIDVINVAHLGSSYRTGDTELSTYKMQLAKRGLDAPDLVVVDLGRADLAMMPTPADFERQVNVFLDRLYAISPRTRVLLTRIQNIPEILNRPDRAALRFANLADAPCSLMYKTGDIATRTGLIPGQDNSAAIIVAAARYQALNKILQDTVASRQARGAAIAWAVTTPDQADPEAWDQYLTFDCVHVNVKGQQMVADHLWPAVQQIMVQAPDAPRPIAPQTEPKAPNLSVKGQQLWNSYVKGIPQKDLQADCHPQLNWPAADVPYQGVVVLVHGFTTCPQDFFAISKALTARGYAVVLPLLPGHGRMWTTDDADGAIHDIETALPSAHLAEPNNYREAYDGLAQFLNLLAPEFAGQRIAGGVSLGAAVATAMVTSHPELWDRQILLSPFYQLSDPFLRTTLGVIANAGAINQHLQDLFDPLLAQTVSWGPICERARLGHQDQESGVTRSRAGYCQFTVNHALAANQFGFESWSNVQPRTVKTQVIAVQDDAIPDQQSVFSAVGRMRNEVLGSAPFTAAERFDTHPDVRVCYMPSSARVCDDNLALPLNAQAKPCVNHVMVSPYDDPYQSTYWLPKLIPEIVEFIAAGTPLPADLNHRANGDPLCAGFPRA